MEPLREDVEAIWNNALRMNVAVLSKYKKKTQWFKSKQNNLTFSGLNLFKKRTVISIKPQQCNILLICGEKSHNGFLGRRTMKVSNISELREDSAPSSRTLHQDGFVLTWEAVILCPTTEGHVTSPPEMPSTLMPLIFSLQGFYMFIILNKPWLSGTLR